MTEYWKSQAKKYCDFCKVWITDNKASVNFHDQGKTHQANVEKKLSELRKKGQVESTKKYELDMELKKMEQAALKSYHQDLTNNPDFTAYAVTQKYPQAVRNLPAAGSSKGRGTQSAAEAAALAAAAELGPGPGPSMPLLPPPKVWYEAKTPEGYSYYWHVESQETRWDPPEEGYVSVLEQQLEELKNSVESNETGEISGGSTVQKKKKKKKKQKYDFSQPLANNDYDDEPDKNAEPAPVEKPYGDWQTVEKPPEPTKVNLQLPKIQFLKPKAPVISEEPKVTFKEKIVVTSAVPVVKRDPDEVAFKKRKLDDTKKNFRQRDTE